MNLRLIVPLLLIILLGLSAFFLLSQTPPAESEDIKPTPTQSETLPTDVIEAMDDAIDDEYRALSFYDIAQDKFDDQEIFASMSAVQQKKISGLSNLYDKYDILVPENSWPQIVYVPESALDACSQGITFATDNTILYGEDLLKVVRGHDDIERVFSDNLSMSKTQIPPLELCN